MNKVMKYNTAFVGLPLAFVGNENQDNINVAQALT
jgi:hypothetical protein